MLSSKKDFFFTFRLIQLIPVYFNIIISLVVVIITIIGCNQKKGFDSPEELALELFQDLKNVRSQDQLLTLKKYSIDKEELVEIIDNSNEIKKDFNITTHFLNLDLQLTKWIMGNIIKIYPNQDEIIWKGDSIDFDVYRTCEYFRDKSAELIRSKDKYMEKKEFIDSRWYPYDNLLLAFNDYIKDAQFVSLTRGRKRTRDDYIKQQLGGCYIHFIVGEQEKKLYVENIIQTKNSWQIGVFND